MSLRQDQAKGQSLQREAIGGVLMKLKHMGCSVGVVPKEVAV